jgi:DNA-binding transcriptional LysR family regulator
MVAPITPVTGTVLDARGFDGWPTDYFQRQVKYQIEGLEAALELTRQGLCAGFFPKFLVKLHNSEMGAAFHLEPLTLPVKLRPQTLTLYLVRRSSDEDDLITRKLAKALRQVAKD